MEISPLSRVLHALAQPGGCAWERVLEPSTSAVYVGTAVYLAELGIIIIEILCLIFSNNLLNFVSTVITKFVSF